MMGSSTLIVKGNKESKSCDEYNVNRFFFLSGFARVKFIADVMKPLKIDDIIDQEVQNLSGGELQRVALVLCLGKPADVYLIDEPSAHLDSEQRLVAAKVIKRYILHAKKTAFVVEHDFIMATYLADRVIVFEGEPSRQTVAHSPQALLPGMNRFLEMLGITFRRDPNNFRPRINKEFSVKVSITSYLLTVNVFLFQILLLLPDLYIFVSFSFFEWFLGH